MRPAQCTVDDCAKPCKAKGMCDMHYWRVRKYGTTSLPPRESLTPADYARRYRERHPARAAASAARYRASHLERIRERDRATKRTQYDAMTPYERVVFNSRSYLNRVENQIRRSDSASHLQQA